MSIISDLWQLVIESDMATKQEVKYIHIKGARAHNLKNIDVDIPKNKLVVVTGVSGSGKSSLVMDTLYAEGQRRYVESLSSYARQFLTRLDKPDVDYIHGICPAIAIEQKVTTRTSRSTVGSLTEIFDYLKLLYARAGKTYSPISGNEVKKHSVSDVVDYLLQLPEGSKVQILAPLVISEGRTLATSLQILLQKGYSRLLVDGERVDLEDAMQNLQSLSKKAIQILIDRYVIKETVSETERKRMSDSVQTAFHESGGDCWISEIGGATKTFSNRFELDGIRFEEPSVNFFSYNNSYGACKRCEGFGTIVDIDPELVIPDRKLSVYEGAIAAWRGEKMKAYQTALVKNGIHFDFPVHRAIEDLTPEEEALIWKGNSYFEGLHDFFKMVEENSYKIQYRVMLSRFRGKTTCTECAGTRLRMDAHYVKIGEHSLPELLVMPIDDLAKYFENIELTDYQQEIADRILVEVNNRIGFMQDVGLGYLTLNRYSNTLSGGETQRINLTRTLGSNLTSSLYILDEPSIGLHSKDTERLIKVLKRLRDLGNTVVVVEHDEDIIRKADYIIDVGLDAGIFGGQIITAGDYKVLMSDKAEGYTTKYLKNEMAIAIPAERRSSASFIEIKGANQHNLQNVSAKIPLNAITVVTGVSGSGKTTLIKQILYPVLHNHFNDGKLKAGKHESITGDINRISQIELVDQNPIGRSSRSNPVTYVKAYDAIRDLFADQQLSKIRGFKPKHFSFNVEGGRCETCKGEGETIVEMQFLADVHLTCEDCLGQRFKAEVLDVQYQERNIFDVLNLSIDEALAFFKERADILSKLQPLADVGLGYVKLGQSSNTLSGGEAQRVKLASFLTKGEARNPILFVFDEPTTGLHFHDINKLLASFNALVENGHSVLVIEHNMDVIKACDWLIDLGPEGGRNGGRLLYQGAPEGLIDVKESHTAPFLQEKLTANLVSS